jgi:hypothetical protein
MKNITYITYQSFPAETANSLQTISNIKYLVKNNAKVHLIFPIREKTSEANIEVIKNYYSIEEDFKVTGFKHFLPFGRIKLLEGFFFHVSHFLWSYFVVSFKIRKTSDRIFMTRSDWILYFLARQNKIVLFECHQVSRVRTFVLNKVKKQENVKIIFLNKNLQTFYGMNDKNSSILHNGVDSDMFNKKNYEMNSDKKEIIFVGNLKRFNKERGVEFLIDSFLNSDFLKKHILSIVGGPNAEAEKIRNKISSLNLGDNIKVTGRVHRSEIPNIYKNAKLGILINSSSNLHSYEYTSPLKYFEYIYSGLRVVAVDFPSHRVLPGNENIIFFEENNNLSFEKAIKKALELPANIDQSMNDISLDNRAMKILNLII